MAAAKNPGNRKAEKLWRDAIMRAVKRSEGKGDPKALERLADKIVQMALDGDMAAIKEIGDRLDGRATQPIEVNLGGTIEVKFVS